MKPASWTEAFVGVCCLLVPLWLVPELLLGYIHDPYTNPGIVRILFLAGIYSGLLLLGSIGMSLLTGEYHKHRKIFHRIWLLVAIFSVISVLFTWADLTTVR